MSMIGETRELDKVMDWLRSVEMPIARRHGSRAGHACEVNGVLSRLLHCLNTPLFLCGAGVFLHTILRESTTNKHLACTLCLDLTNDAVRASGHSVIARHTIDSWQFVPRPHSLPDF